MADVAVENAPNDENDDNWLYGESNNEQADENDTENAEKTQPSNIAANKNTGTEDKDQEENEAGEGHNDDSHFNDEHFGEVSRDNKEDANGDADSQENGDSDSDDSDDVKVTIGEIKSGPQAYASLNIKRGVGLVGTGGAEKPRQGPAAGNKVTLEDLEGPGSINGVPALEFNIDTIEDKPWNKPGADISDYFNYGFNEVTWSAYCERQRRMRVNETGVGLHAPPPRAPAPDMRRPPGPIRHDEMAPGIQGNYQNRENTIQVMTAERREYGRGPARDAPPEYFGAPPPEHYYPPPLMTYDEPWAGHPGHAPHPGIGPHPGHPEGGWAPGDIKELTPGPLAPPAPAAPIMGAPPPPLLPHYRPPDRHERERHERERHERERHERDRRERDERHRRDEEERDRDRERDRSRSIKPDRIREKSYRRERSRSRSRRHKSRSRSPRPRERSRDRERDRDRDRERDRDRKPKTKETKEKEDEK